MIISIKSASRLIGISIITCCAVLVCTMFLNFYLDVSTIRDEITSQVSMIFYNAQVSTAKVVCLVTGGCLLMTSVVMLMFYIKHYIDTHKKELGILKALGYSNLKIAKGFWIFGISAFIGSAIGFCGAFLLMPRLYALQNKDGLLPEFTISFHPSVFLYLVILPTLAFSLLAIGYACLKLRMPVLSLLKDSFRASKRAKKRTSQRSHERSFLDQLKNDTLKRKKSLAFFIIFASFCFSAMTQMSFSMRELSSELMGLMMLIIGLILAFTTLFLAVTTVIGGNTKTIAMMRVFGYSQRECRCAILDCYRPLTYIGFAVGTLYQYLLLRLMVDIVFADMGSVPEYKFDFVAAAVSLAVFIVIYELLMLGFAAKIQRVTVKEIMTE